MKEKEKRKKEKLVFILVEVNLGEIGGFLLLKNHDKQERQSEMRTCMQDAFINASKELGQPVLKEMIYKKCKPSLYIDTKMSDILPYIQNLFKITVDMTQFTTAGGGRS